MLEIQHLSLAYGQHRALDAIDLCIKEGEAVAILGANGAGKSSLLKSIAGLTRPGPGAVLTFDGLDLSTWSADRIVEAGIALVPEGRGVFGTLTVDENLLLGAFARRARGAEASNRAFVLDLFPKLAERRRQPVRTMSGGEQQMVALARALMSAPRLLMLDEPSLGLAPIVATEMFHALAAIRGRGVAILMVEQNVRQSLAIADRAYLLANGRIIGEGVADQWRHDPIILEGFLGGSALPTSKESPWSTRSSS